MRDFYSLKAADSNAEQVLKILGQPNLKKPETINAEKVNYEKQIEKKTDESNEVIVVKHCRN